MDESQGTPGKLRTTPYKPNEQIFPNTSVETRPGPFNELFKKKKIIFS